MRLLICMLLSCLMLGTATAQQPAYPSKPIKLIIPFAPGGSTDIAGRVIAEKLGARLGQPIIIDNRPGADGLVGAEAGARSPGDGYTLFMGVTSTHAISMSLVAKMPYHPLKDFEPIVQMTNFPALVLVNPAFAPKNIPELVAAAKVEPNKLSFGSDSVTTTLIMQHLMTKTGIDLVKVPYKGSAPLLTDLMAGHIKVAVTGLVASQAYLASGRVRAIAVTSSQRLESYPDIPTVAEQGFPGFAPNAWTGLLAPKGTPRVIVDRLATETIAVLAMPDVRERLKGLGATTVGSRPDEFAAFIDAEIQRWGEAVKAAGMKPE